MHRIIIVLILGAAICGCASTQPVEDSPSDADTVQFSASQSGGNFTITCRPKTDAIGKLSAWVDICNRLGHDALRAAARDGLIAPVSGAAFGMSSEFVRSIPADAPVSSKLMSRDVPLIGPAL